MKDRKLNSRAYTIIFVALALLGVFLMISFRAVSRHTGSQASSEAKAYDVRDDYVKKDAGGQQIDKPLGLQHGNSMSPGQRLQLRSFLSSKTPTVFYVHSGHCKYCQQMEPLIQKLASETGEAKFVEVQLDRRGVDEIDYNSPAGEQFKIDAVPAFVVYGKDGRIQLIGAEARDYVNSLRINTRMLN